MKPFYQDSAAPRAILSWKGKITSAMKLSLGKAREAMHGGMAQWQLLLFSLPRIKWELPQSRSASHPLYCQLRKKKKKDNKQTTTNQALMRKKTVLLTWPLMHGGRPDTNAGLRHQLDFSDTLTPCSKPLQRCVNMWTHLCLKFKHDLNRSSYTSKVILVQIWAHCNCLSHMSTQQVF